MSENQQNIELKIGRKIKIVREQKNIPRKALAHALGLSVSGFGRIEREEVSISIEKVLLICHELQTDINELLKTGENFGISNFNTYDSSQVVHTIYNQHNEDLIAAQQKSLDLLTEQLKVMRDIIEKLSEKR